MASVEASGNPRVLIIGGGVSGALVAHAIRKQCTQPVTIHVTSARDTIGGGRMGSVAVEGLIADVAAQVLSIDLQVPAATEWIDRLNEASLVVQAESGGRCTSLAAVPERPDGWTRRNGQWEHWWARGGCGSVVQWIMEQASPDLEMRSAVDAAIKCPNGQWRVSSVGPGAATAVATSEYDAIVIATDAAAAAGVLERSDVPVQPCELQALRAVMGPVRGVYVVPVDSAVLAGLFKGKAEWRDPRHDTLHLLARQNAKRASTHGGGAEHARDLLVVHTVPMPLQSAGPEILERVWAERVGPAVSELLTSHHPRGNKVCPNMGPAFVLGAAHVAGTSNVAAALPSWQAQRCWRIDSGLVACGDYFDAASAASFTGSVLSARAAAAKVMADLATRGADRAKGQEG